MFEERKKKILEILKKKEVSVMLEFEGKAYTSKDIIYEIETKTLLGDKFLKDLIAMSYKKEILKVLISLKEVCPNDAQPLLAIKGEIYDLDNLISEIKQGTPKGIKYIIELFNSVGIENLLERPQKSILQDSFWNDKKN